MELRPAESRLSHQNTSVVQQGCEVREQQPSRI
jgi:hypothetical protein